MRIISGQYRGRKLKGPRGRVLRPTADRLKETLFNILGPDIRDAVFLDVFAGSGAVGLEALSRGARQTVFIESSAEGIRLIRDNLNILGVSDGYRLLTQDVWWSLRHLVREKVVSDIVFLDPPYRWERYAELLKYIFDSGLLRSRSRVIVEHHRKSALPDGCEGYHRVRTVQQGEKCLSFYVPDPLPAVRNSLSK